MEQPSSTSSSNIRGKLPWALLLALGIFVGLECALRVVPSDKLIPYHLDSLESQAVRHVLQANGPADICIIGSSRTREAISVPFFTNYLAQVFPEPVTLVNYACAGARADLVHTITKYMLNGAKKPKLVLYGITPRQFLSDMERQNLSAYFWDLKEWSSIRAGSTNTLTAYLPQVARNEMGKWSLIVRYRKKAGILLKTFFTGHPQISSPLFGQPTEWHHNEPHVSLVNRPLSDERVEWYVKLFLDRAGSYPLTDSKEAHVRAVVQLCKQRNIPIVFFEVPTSPLLKNHLPRDVYPEFRRRMQKIVEEKGVAYLDEAQLNLKLGEKHYLEESHLNEDGAKLLSKGLVDQVVLPFLGSGNLP